MLLWPSTEAWGPMVFPSSSSGKGSSFRGLISDSVGLSLSPQGALWGIDMELLLLTSKQNTVPSFPAQGFALQLSSAYYYPGCQRKFLLVSHSPLSSALSLLMSLGLSLGSLGIFLRACPRMGNPQQQKRLCKPSLSDSEQVWLAALHGISTAMCYGGIFTDIHTMGWKVKLSRYPPARRCHLTGKV